jgi:hypothetical protein
MENSIIVIQYLLRIYEDRLIKGGRKSAAARQARIGTLPGILRHRSADQYGVGH